MTYQFKSLADNLQFAQKTAAAFLWLKIPSLWSLGSSRLQKESWKWWWAKKPAHIRLTRLFWRNLQQAQASWCFAACAVAVALWLLLKVHKHNLCKNEDNKGNKADSRPGLEGKNSAHTQIKQKKLLVVFDNLHGKMSDFLPTANCYALSQHANSKKWTKMLPCLMEKIWNLIELGACLFRVFFLPLEYLNAHEYRLKHEAKLKLSSKVLTVCREIFVAHLKVRIMDKVCQEKHKVILGEQLFCVVVPEN